MNGPSVTKDGRPLSYPTNPLTQAMFDGINAAREGRGGVSASPPPAVKSNAWGVQVPLSQEETKELDARLAALSGAEVEKVDVPPPVIHRPQVNRFVPNFKNIQGIDLDRNIIRVDNLEFPLAESDAKQLRLLCVDCVLNAVVAGLKDMLGDSGIESSALAARLKEDVFGRGKEETAVSEGLRLPGGGEAKEDGVEKK